MSLESKNECEILVILALNNCKRLPDPHSSARLRMATQSSIFKHNRFLWCPRGWKLGLGKQETHGPPALKEGALKGPQCIRKQEGCGVTD